MRAGACALQQTLTSEAASVLKHSLSLARRRGHAQVTPLHVAAILLSSRVSLLRTACLKSQPNQASHPLQCRALELCFNVALNRLPTTPGPLLHGQPSLSNALIAALKRAQAHQRRGCIEQQQQQQQQPLLAIKVELEQLILSILDDPSVSRVMREAGFSSTAVKNNLEDSSASTVFQCYNSSGGVYSTPSSPPSESHREVINPGGLWQTHFLTYSSAQNPFLFSPQKKILSNPTTETAASLKEDIKLVLEVLLRKKRRNTVIVGDSMSMTEGLVLEIMSKIEKGDVPDDMKSARFLKFIFSSVPLRFMKREEVEQNLSDLKRKVDSLASGGGVIIYTGDLKWTVESSVGEREEGGLYNKEASGYSPVDHLVEEIGKMLSDYSSSNTKVWLMATANYQTYMRCQVKEPSLEMQWALQAVSVPSAGLGLSLNATSVHDSRATFSLNPCQILSKKPVNVKEEQDVLTCCTECTSNYEKEAGLFKSAQKKSSSSFINSSNTKDMDRAPNQLPYWLQPQETEAHQKDGLVELRRKWNRLCHTLHQGRHIQNNVNSPSFTIRKNDSYPLWPNQKSMFSDLSSLSFVDAGLKPNNNANYLPRFRRQQSCHIEFSFSNGNHRHQLAEPNLDSLKIKDDVEVKISLSLGNSLFPDTGNLAEPKCRRTMRNENIGKLLVENVPWQSQIIPAIVEVLIDPKLMKKDAWLLIEGNDSIGKRRLARSIAESVFGSAELLFCLNMREKDNKMSSCSELLKRALRDHETLVVFVENIDFADAQFVNFLADGFESGKFGKESTGQAIFIMTKGDYKSYEDGKENQRMVIQMNLQVSDRETPMFDHKRKADWDLSSKSKNSKTIEKDTISSIGAENGSIKKEFTRQLSSNSLDLNLRAEEDDESAEEQGEYCRISSDLTRETSNDHKNPVGFIEQIKNRFVLNQDSIRESQMREMFMSKIKGAFVEVMGTENMGCLTVDHVVVEEILLWSGSFLNSLFEKWLKDIFQTSLHTVKIGGKESMDLRLCLGGRGENDLQDGFMGSFLPNRIQVSFT